MAPVRRASPRNLPGGSSMENGCVPPRSMENKQEKWPKNRMDIRWQKEAKVRVRVRVRGLASWTVARPPQSSKTAVFDLFSV